MNIFCSSVSPNNFSARAIPPGPTFVGFTMNLECTAMVGDLPIFYTWIDPNGQDLSRGDTDGNISIVISDSYREQSIFTCVASNDFGNNSAVVQLSLIGMFSFYRTWLGLCLHYPRIVPLYIILLWLVFIKVSLP